MEVPRDVYYYMIFLMDDVDVTKTIRSICKQGLLASNDYNNMLLNEKVNVNCERGEWVLHVEENEKYGGDKYYHWHPVFGDCITFNMTKKDLYSSVIKSKYIHTKYDLRGCWRFVIESKK